MSSWGDGKGPGCPRPEISSVLLPACCFAISLSTSVFFSYTVATCLARPVEVMS